MKDIIPGCVETQYCGFRMFEFEFDGCPCKIVAPHNPREGKMWVWKAEFFTAFPKFELAMLEKGFYLAFMSVGNTFGCPSAMEHFEHFYGAMSEKWGFSSYPVMLGLSRGSLYIYNFAIRNPEKVACLYSDNGVCDFKSWPGGKGCGEGSEKDWLKLWDDYGFKSEAEAMAYRGNPVDNLEILAKSGVLLVHASGTDDPVVPVSENTDIVEKRYLELGGKIKVFRHPGAHHPHGLDDPEPLIDYILKNARGVK